MRPFTGRAFRSLQSFQQQKSIQVKFFAFIWIVWSLCSHTRPISPAFKWPWQMPDDKVKKKTKKKNTGCLHMTVFSVLFLHIRAAVLNLKVRAAGAWRWPRDIASAWRKRLDIFILYLLGYIRDLRWNPRDPWCRQKFGREVERYYGRLWCTRSQLSRRFKL